MFVHLNHNTGYLWDPGLVPDWLSAILIINVMLSFTCNPLIYVVSYANYRRYRM